MKQDKEILKSYFETGDKPTQEQYHDTWDSFWHKDEIIPSNMIEPQGLQQVTDEDNTTTNNISIENSNPVEPASITLVANNYGTNFSVEADNNDGTFKIRNAGSDRITLDEDGVILAPNTSISNINTGGDKSLVTKEYADANYSVGGSNRGIQYNNNGVLAASSDVEFNETERYLSVMGMTFGFSGAHRIINSHSDSGSLLLEGGSRNGNGLGASIQLYGTGHNTGRALIKANNQYGVSVNGSGRVAIGAYDAISEKLEVNGNVLADGFKLSTLNTAPSSATDTGIVGDIRVTATHIYVCVATDTWARAALTTW